MRLSTTAALAGFCASAHAFSDSSPFMLFSTAVFSNPRVEHALQSSSRVFESTKELLSSCPTDHYLLVSQPNLNFEHIKHNISSKIPNESRAYRHATSKYAVAEVMGEVDLEAIAVYIREVCGDGLPRSAIEEIHLEPLPLPYSAATVEKLKENDNELGAVLEQYKAAAGSSYTVIYAGVPRVEKPQTDSVEFPNGGVDHSELKRNSKRQERRSEDLPLFEKYQFFTPGIFMALIALIFLMSILYVGISAVASLQVSYGAFEKEMGPAAQKKQQS